jgi:CelD/BcsL family acetyltransferase involved in cellulose biosynthesis
MQVSKITSSVEFSSLREEWNRLLSASGLANIFLTHEWLLSWWEVYGEDFELLVLTCRDDLKGSLVGAFPLYRVREGFLPQVQTLRFIAGNQTGSDFLEPISLPGERERILAAFFEYIEASKTDWDVIEFEGVDAESPFATYLHVAGLVTSDFATESTQVCPFIELPSSWDALLAGVSKKVRQKIGYYRRALGRIGGYEVRRIQEVGELRNALQQLMRIRKDRLEVMGIDFDKVKSSYERFHNAVMERFYHNGWLQVFFLNLNGLNIAYIYQFAYGKRIFFYQTGFDRAWVKQSVGFVLLSHVLQESIYNDYELFEFLRGDEQYKYDWNVSGHRKLINLKIFNKNYKSKIYNIKHKSFYMINNNISKIINSIRNYIMRLKINA